MAVPRGAPRLSVPHRSTAERDRSCPDRREVPEQDRPHRPRRRARAQHLWHPVHHRRRRVPRKGDPELRRHVRLRRLQDPGALRALVRSGDRQRNADEAQRSGRSDGRLGLLLRGPRR
jgi:hypothetical protein